MTAIYYPDCWQTSPNEHFVLDARSQHNGTISHRNGSPATEKEFGFKYREHQREFRYRLLRRSSSAARSPLAVNDSDEVVWERWQSKSENSPHEVVVADDGWSAIRTHGFRPEVIIISPSGKDVIRVRIVSDHLPDTECDEATVNACPTFSWSAKHLSHTTAGIYWAGHSWPYFIRLRDHSYFVWRTYWGDRLVIDLVNATLASDEAIQSEALQGAMRDEERRGALQLFVHLSPYMSKIEHLLSTPESEEEMKPPPWREKVWRLTAALHLAGVHRITASIPYLRRWEPIDCPSYSTASALGQGWSLQVQYYRPVLRQSLRLLGEEPRQAFPAYYFIDRDGSRLAVSERIGIPQKWADELGDAVTAHQVLGMLGIPDHIRRRSHPDGRGLFTWTEEWEYDSLVDGRWGTLRITWDEKGQKKRLGRIIGVEEISPYWLDTDQREKEMLSL